MRRAMVQDYPQYLINNQGASHLPTTAAASRYAWTPATRSHHYEFRSALAGHANLWVVAFGQLLDVTAITRRPGPQRRAGDSPRRPR